MGKLISWSGGLRWMPDIGDEVIVGAATIHNDSGARGIVTDERSLPENSYLTEYQVQFGEKAIWIGREHVYRPDLYESATY